MPERTHQGSRKPAAEVKGKTRTNRKWKEAWTAVYALLAETMAEAA